MMIVSAILPLVFIIAIIAFTAIVIRPRAAKFLQGKRINWVFGGYLTILLIATFVSLALPEESTYQGEVLSASELKKELAETNTFMNLARRGKIEEANGAVLKKEWEIPMEAKVLNVPVADSDYYISVLVEKKEEKDGVIEAAHYAGKSFIKNVDVTSELKSPTVRIIDGNLEVFPPSQVKLELAQFSQPLPFYQFNEGYNSMFKAFGVSHGWEVLYLRVPADVTVNGDVQTVTR